MSTAERFEKTLRTECEHFARHYGYPEDNLDRGFEGYAVHLFAQEHGFHEVLDGEDSRLADLEANLLRERDLGIDGVLEDSFNKRLCLLYTSDAADE